MLSENVLAKLEGLRIVPTSCYLYHSKAYIKWNIMMNFYFEIITVDKDIDIFMKASVIKH